MLSYVFYYPLDPSQISRHALTFLTPPPHNLPLPSVTLLAARPLERACVWYLRRTLASFSIEVGAIELSLLRGHVVIRHLALPPALLDTLELPLLGGAEVDEIHLQSTYTRRDSYFALPFGLEINISGVRLLSVTRTYPPPVPPAEAVRAEREAIEARLHMKLHAVDRVLWRDMGSHQSRTTSLHASTVMLLRLGQWLIHTMRLWVRDVAVGVRITGSHASTGVPPPCTSNVLNGRRVDPRDLSLMGAGMLLRLGELEVAPAGMIGGRSDPHGGSRRNPNSTFGKSPSGWFGRSSSVKETPSTSTSTSTSAATTAPPGTVHMDAFDSHLTLRNLSIYTFGPPPVDGAEEPGDSTTTTSSSANFDTVIHNNPMLKSWLRRAPLSPVLRRWGLNVHFSFRPTGVEVCPTRPSARSRTRLRSMDQKGDRAWVSDDSDFNHDNDDRDDDNDVTGPGPSTSSSRHASMPISGPQNIMGWSRLVVPEPEESSVLARVSLHAMLLHFTTPSLQRVLAVSGAMLDYTRFQSSRRMRPQVSPARDPRAWWRHAIACILLERRRALLETHAVSESFTETRGGTSLALDHLALTFMPERKASYSALYERYLQARAAQNSRPVTFRRVAAELQASERKLPIQDILTWRWLVWVRLEDTKATPGIMHRMRQVWSKMTSMFVTSTSTGDPVTSKRNADPDFGGLEISPRATRKLLRVQEVVRGVIRVGRRLNVDGSTANDTAHQLQGIFAGIRTQTYVSCPKLSVSLDIIDPLHADQDLPQPHPHPQPHANTHATHARDPRGMPRRRVLPPLYFEVAILGVQCLTCLGRPTVLYGGLDSIPSLDASRNAHRTVDTTYDTKASSSQSSSLYTYDDHVWSRTSSSARASRRSLRWRRSPRLSPDVEDEITTNSSTSSLFTFLSVSTMKRATAAFLRAAVWAGRGLRWAVGRTVGGTMGRGSAQRRRRPPKEGTDYKRVVESSLSMDPEDMLGGEPFSIDVVCAGFAVMTRDSTSSSSSSVFSSRTSSQRIMWCSPQPLLLCPPEAGFWSRTSSSSPLSTTKVPFLTLSWCKGQWLGQMPRGLSAARRRRLARPGMLVNVAHAQMIHSSTTFCRIAMALAIAGQLPENLNPIAVMQRVTIRLTVAEKLVSVTSFQQQAHRLGDSALGPFKIQCGSWTFLVPARYAIDASGDDDLQHNVPKRQPDKTGGRSAETRGNAGWDTLRDVMRGPSAQAKVGEDEGPPPVSESSAVSMGAHFLILRVDGLVLCSDREDVGLTVQAEAEVEEEVGLSDTDSTTHVTEEVDEGWDGASIRSSMSSGISDLSTSDEEEEEEVETVDADDLRSADRGGHSMALRWISHRVGSVPSHKARLSMNVSVSLASRAIGGRVETRQVILDPVKLSARFMSCHEPDRALFRFYHDLDVDLRASGARLSVSPLVLGHLQGLFVDTRERVRATGALDVLDSIRGTILVARGGDNDGMMMTTMDGDDQDYGHHPRLAAGRGRPTSPPAEVGGARGVQGNIRWFESLAARISVESLVLRLVENIITREGSHRRQNIDEIISLGLRGFLCTAAWDRGDFQARVATAQVVLYNHLVVSVNEADPDIYSSSTLSSTTDRRSHDRSGKASPHPVGGARRRSGGGPGPGLARGPTSVPQHGRGMPSRVGHVVRPAPLRRHVQQGLGRAVSDAARSRMAFDAWRGATSANMKSRGSESLSRWSAIRHDLAHLAPQPTGMLFGAIWLSPDHPPSLAIDLGHWWCRIDTGAQRAFFRHMARLLAKTQGLMDLMSAVNEEAFGGDGDVFVRGPSTEGDNPPHDARTTTAAAVVPPTLLPSTPTPPPGLSRAMQTWTPAHLSGSGSAGVRRSASGRHVVTDPHTSEHYSPWSGRTAVLRVESVTMTLRVRGQLLTSLRVGSSVIQTRETFTPLTEDAAIFLKYQLPRAAIHASHVRADWSTAAQIKGLNVLDHLTVARSPYRSVVQGDGDRDCVVHVAVTNRMLVDMRDWTSHITTKRLMMYGAIPANHLGGEGDRSAINRSQDLDPIRRHHGHRRGHSFQAFGVQHSHYIQREAGAETDYDRLRRRRKSSEIPTIFARGDVAAKYPGHAHMHEPLGFTLDIPESSPGYFTQFDRLGRVSSLPPTPGSVETSGGLGSAADMNHYQQHRHHLSPSNPIRNNQSTRSSLRRCDPPGPRQLRDRLVSPGVVAAFWARASDPKPNVSIVRVGVEDMHYTMLTRFVWDVQFFVMEVQRTMAMIGSLMRQLPSTSSSSMNPSQAPISDCARSSNSFGSSRASLSSLSSPPSTSKSSSLEQTREREANAGITATTSALTTTTLSALLEVEFSRFRWDMPRNSSSEQFLSHRIDWMRIANPVTLDYALEARQRVRLVEVGPHFSPSGASFQQDWLSVPSLSVPLQKHVHEVLTQPLFGITATPCSPSSYTPKSSPRVQDRRSTHHRSRESLLGEPTLPQSSRSSRNQSLSSVVDSSFGELPSNTSRPPLGASWWGGSAWLSTLGPAVTMLSVDEHIFDRCGCTIADSQPQPGIVMVEMSGLRSFYCMMEVNPMSGFDPRPSDVIAESHSSATHTHTDQPSPSARSGPGGGFYVHTEGRESRAAGLAAENRDGRSGYVPHNLDLYPSPGVYWRHWMECSDIVFTFVSGPTPDVSAYDLQMTIPGMRMVMSESIFETCVAFSMENFYESPSFFDESLGFKEAKAGYHWGRLIGSVLPPVPPEPAYLGIDDDLEPRWCTVGLDVTRFEMMWEGVAETTPITRKLLCGIGKEELALLKMADARVDVRLYRPDWSERVAWSAHGVRLFDMRWRNSAGPLPLLSIPVPRQFHSQAAMRLRSAVRRVIAQVKNGGETEGPRPERGGGARRGGLEKPINTATTTTKAYKRVPATRHGYRSWVTEGVLGIEEDDSTWPDRRFDLDFTMQMQGTLWGPMCNEVGLYGPEIQWPYLGDTSLFTEMRRWCSKYTWQPFVFPFHRRKTPDEWLYTNIRLVGASLLIPIPDTPRAPTIGQVPQGGRTKLALTVHSLRLLHAFGGDQESLVRTDVQHLAVGLRDHTQDDDPTTDLHTTRKHRKYNPQRSHLPRASKTTTRVNHGSTRTGGDGRPSNSDAFTSRYYRVRHTLSPLLQPVQAYMEISTHDPKDIKAQRVTAVKAAVQGFHLQPAFSHVTALAALTSLVSLARQPPPPSPSPSPSPPVAPAPAPAPPGRLRAQLPGSVSVSSPASAKSCISSQSQAQSQGRNTGGALRSASLPTGGVTMGAKNSSAPSLMDMSVELGMDLNANANASLIFGTPAGRASLDGAADMDGEDEVDQGSIPSHPGPDGADSEVDEWRDAPPVRKGSGGHDAFLQIETATEVSDTWGFLRDHCPGGADALDTSDTSQPSGFSRWPPDSIHTVDSDFGNANGSSSSSTVAMGRPPGAGDGGNGNWPAHGPSATVEASSPWPGSCPTEPRHSPTPPSRSHLVSLALLTETVDFTLVDDRSGFPIESLRLSFSSVSVTVSREVMKEDQPPNMLAHVSLRVDLQALNSNMNVMEYLVEPIMMVIEARNAMDITNVLVFSESMMKVVASSSYFRSVGDCLSFQRLFVAEIAARRPLAEISRDDHLDISVDDFSHAKVQRRTPVPDSTPLTLEPRPDGTVARTPSALYVVRNETGWKIFLWVDGRGDSGDDDHRSGGHKLAYELQDGHQVALHEEPKPKVVRLSRSQQDVLARVISIRFQWSVHALEGVVVDKVGSFAYEMPIDMGASSSPRAPIPVVVDIVLARRTRTILIRSPLCFVNRTIMPLFFRASFTSDIPEALTDTLGGRVVHSLPTNHRALFPGTRCWAPVGTSAARINVAAEGYHFSEKDVISYTSSKSPIDQEGEILCPPTDAEQAAHVMSLVVEPRLLSALDSEDSLTSRVKCFDFVFRAALTLSNLLPGPASFRIWCEKTATQLETLLLPGGKLHVYAFSLDHRLHLSMNYGNRGTRGVVIHRPVSDYLERDLRGLLEEQRTGSRPKENIKNIQLKLTLVDGEERRRARALGLSLQSRNSTSNIWKDLTVLCPYWLVNASGFDIRWREKSLVGLRTREGLAVLTRKTGEPPSPLWATHGSVQFALSWGSAWSSSVNLNQVGTRGTVYVPASQSLIWEGEATRLRNLERDKILSLGQVVASGTTSGLGGNFHARGGGGGGSSSGIVSGSGVLADIAADAVRAIEAEQREQRRKGKDKGKGKVTKRLDKSGKGDESDADARRRREVRAQRQAALAAPPLNPDGSPSATTGLIPNQGRVQFRPDLRPFFMVDHADSDSSRESGSNDDNSDTDEDDMDAGLVALEQELQRQAELQAQAQLPPSGGDTSHSRGKRGKKEYGGKMKKRATPTRLRSRGRSHNNGEDEIHPLDAIEHIIPESWVVHNRYEAPEERRVPTPRHKAHLHESGPALNQQPDHGMPFWYLSDGTLPHTREGALERIVGCLGGCERGSTSTSRKKSSRVELRPLLGLAVEIALGPGSFGLTKVITIGPRYHLYNSTDQVMEVTQRGAIMRGRPVVCRIEPDQSTTFHWPDASSKPELAVRYLARDCAFSGGFRIESSEEVALRLPTAYGMYGRSRTGGSSGSGLVGAPPRGLPSLAEAADETAEDGKNLPMPSWGYAGIIRAIVKLNRAAVAVTFVAAAGKTAPYRIENRCRRLRVMFRQALRSSGSGSGDGDGSDDAWQTLTESGGEHAQEDFAWDEPLELRRVLVRVERSGFIDSGVRDHEYSLDSIKQHPSITMVRKKNEYKDQQGPGLASKVAAELLFKKRHEHLTSVAHVYVSVYADGPTRVLLFSDSPDMRNAAADERREIRQQKARKRRLLEQLDAAKKRLAALQALDNDFIIAGTVPGSPMWDQRPGRGEMGDDGIPLPVQVPVTMVRHPSQSLSQAARGGTNGTTRTPGPQDQDETRPTRGRTLAMVESNWETKGRADGRSSPAVMLSAPSPPRASAEDVEEGTPSQIPVRSVSLPTHPRGEAAPYVELSPTGSLSPRSPLGARMFAAVRTVMHGTANGVGGGLPTFSGASDAIALATDAQSRIVVSKMERKPTARERWQLAWKKAAQKANERNRGAGPGGEEERSIPPMRYPSLAATIPVPSVPNRSLAAKSSVPSNASTRLRVSEGAIPASELGFGRGSAFPDGAIGRGVDGSTYNTSDRLTWTLSSRRSPFHRRAMVGVVQPTIADLYGADILLPPPTDGGTSHLGSPASPGSRPPPGLAMPMPMPLASPTSHHRGHSPEDVVISPRTSSRVFTDQTRSRRFAEMSPQRANMPSLTFPSLDAVADDEHGAKPAASIPTSTSSTQQSILRNSSAIAEAGLESENPGPGQRTNTTRTSPSRAVRRRTSVVFQPQVDPESAEGAVVTTTITTTMTESPRPFLPRSHAHSTGAAGARTSVANRSGGGDGHPKRLSVRVPDPAGRTATSIGNYTNGSSHPLHPLHPSVLANPHRDRGYSEQSSSTILPTPHTGRSDHFLGGELIVQVLSGHGFRRAASARTLAFAVIECEGQTRTTPMLKMTNGVLKWNEEVVFKSVMVTSTVRVALYGHSLLGADSFLGEVVVNCSEVTAGRSNDADDEAWTPNHGYRTYTLARRKTREDVDGMLDLGLRWRVSRLENLSIENRLLDQRLDLALESIAQCKEIGLVETWGPEESVTDDEPDRDQFTIFAEDDEEDEEGRGVSTNARRKGRRKSTFTRDGASSGGDPTNDNRTTTATTPRGGSTANTNTNSRVMTHRREVQTILVQRHRGVSMANAATILDRGSMSSRWGGTGSGSDSASGTAHAFRTDTNPSGSVLGGTGTLGSHHHPMYLPGRLEVTVINARYLTAYAGNRRGARGPQDTFCMVKVYANIGAQSHSTKVMRNTTAPRWNEFFRFEPTLLSDHLEVSLYERRSARSNVLLGACHVPLTRLADRMPRYAWLPLRPPPAEEDGQGNNIGKDHQARRERERETGAEVQVRLRWTDDLGSMDAGEGSMVIDVDLKGVGVLGLDGDPGGAHGMPRELVYATLSDIRLISRRAGSTETFELTVQNIQMDNQMLSSQQPVILSRAKVNRLAVHNLARYNNTKDEKDAFTESRMWSRRQDRNGNGQPQGLRHQYPNATRGKGSKAHQHRGGAAPGDTSSHGGDWATGDDSGLRAHPLVRVRYERSLRPGMPMFPSFRAAVGELDLKVEEEFIDAIFVVYSSLPWDDLFQALPADVAHCSPGAELLAFIRELPLVAFQNHVGGPGEFDGTGSSLGQTQGAAKQALSSVVAGRPKFYIEHLIMEPVGINVTVLPYAGGAGDEGLALHHQLGASMRWARSLGFSLLDIHDVHIHIDALEFRNLIADRDSLMRDITNHLSSHALHAVYKVFGAVDLLAPVTYVANVSNSVIALFSLKLGRDASVKEWGLAVAGRTGSLTKTLVGGLLSTTASLLDGITRMSARLAMDDDYALRARRRPTGVLSGFHMGAQDLLSGIVDGITGVIRAPIIGYEREGFKGLWKGILLGFLGLALKPVTGVLEFSSKIIAGIAASVHAIGVRNRDLIDRVRVSAPHGNAHVLTDHINDAVCKRWTEILRRVRGGKYNQEEVLDMIQHKATKVLLFTAERILLVSIKRRVVRWTARYGSIVSVETYGKTVLLNTKARYRRLRMTLPKKRVVLCESRDLQNSALTKLTRMRNAWLRTNRPLDGTGGLLTMGDLYDADSEDDLALIPEDVNLTIMLKAPGDVMEAGPEFRPAAHHRPTARNIVELGGVDKGEGPEAGDPGSGLYRARGDLRHRNGAGGIVDVWMDEADGGRYGSEHLDDHVRDPPGVSTSALVPAPAPGVDVTKPVPKRKGDVTVGGTVGSGVDRLPLQEQRRTLESQILAVQSLLSDMEGRVLSPKAAEDYTSGLKTLLWVCLETVQELSRGGAPWAASTGLLLRQLSAWVNDLASSAEDPSIIVRTLHAQCRAALRSTMG